MHGVMHEFKHGELHSGSKSGPVVTNRKQAIAIGLSEQRQMGKSVAPKKSASKTRTRSVSRVRDHGGRFDRGSSAVGRGSVSHKPRVLNNPKTLAGRRNASHAKAYPTDDE